MRELGIVRRHDRGRWKNNRAENSHQPLRQRERRMKRFKSPRVGTALSLNPRRRLQCVQRPTPSDLPPTPALISRSGYAHLAPRGSRSVNRCDHGHLACKFLINVTVPYGPRTNQAVGRSRGGLTGKLHGRRCKRCRCVSRRRRSGSGRCGMSRFRVCRPAPPLIIVRADRLDRTETYGSNSPHAPL